MQKVIFFLFFVVFLLTLRDAEAHSLASEKSIEGIVHIDPNDDPVAGRETNFHIEIHDGKSRFNVNECNCEVFLYDQGRIVYSYKNTYEKQSSDLYDINFSYNFPKKGIYELKVSGKPNVENAFESFDLNFEIKVDKVILENKNLVSNLSDFRGQILLAIVAFIFLLVIVMKRIS